MYKIIVTSFLILVQNTFYTQFEKLKSNIDYTVDNCTGEIFIYGESETGTFEVIKLNEDLKVLSSNTFDINLKKITPSILSNGLSTQIILKGRSKSETISLNSGLKSIEEVNFELSKDIHYKHVFGYPTYSSNDTIFAFFFNQNINADLFLSHNMRPLDDPNNKESIFFWDLGINKFYSKKPTLSIFKSTDRGSVRIKDIEIDIKNIGQSIIAMSNDNKIIIAAIDSSTLYIKKINTSNGQEEFSKEVSLSDFGFKSPYTKMSFNKYLNTFSIINLNESLFKKDSAVYTANIVSVNIENNFEISKSSTNNVVVFEKGEKPNGVSTSDLKIRNTISGTYISKILCSQKKEYRTTPNNQDNGFTSTAYFARDPKYLSLYKIIDNNISKQEYSRNYLDQLNFITSNNINIENLIHFDYIIDQNDYNFIFRKNYNPLNRNDNNPLLIYDLEKNETNNELDWSLRNKNDVYPFTAASSPFIRSKIYQTNNEKSIIIFHAVDGPFKKMKFEIEIKELK